MISLLFRFFLSFILGATILILLSGCGGSFEDENEDSVPADNPPLVVSKVPDPVN